MSLRASLRSVLSSGRGRHRDTRKRHLSGLYSRPLHVELLEDRRLLSITVDTLVDELDGSTTDGDISLRDAIALAPPAETIDFSVTGTITLTLGELAIDDDLTITGPGIDQLTVDGNQSSRVFSIGGDDTEVMISGLTISGGYAHGNGGGIYVGSSCELILSDSIVSDNVAWNYSGSSSHGGGGIYNERGTVQITGSTLRDNSIGNSGDGGGFLNYQGACNISDSVIADNSSVGDGGGLFNDGGTVTIISANISGNSTSSQTNKGTGICNNGGTVQITWSTVSGNSPYGHGSVFSSGGALTVSNSSIVDNSGSGIQCGGGRLDVMDSVLSRNAAGGAIVSSGAVAAFVNSTISDNWVSGLITNALGAGIRNVGTLTLTNCGIRGNSTYSGGGLWNEGTAILQNSTVWDNYAFGSGGGLYNSTGGSLVVSNSTISNNWAECWGSYDGGGGIYNTEGTVTVTNSTIANNLSYRKGGGMFNDDGTLAVDNSIIASNIADSSPDVSGAITAQYSLIGIWDGPGTPGDDNIWGTPEEPLDPGLSHWTQQADGLWRYYLLPGSPAIDAGSNALAVDPQGNPLTVDQYGSPRIQNGTVDIGSVEGATAATPGVTYVVQSLDWSIADNGILTIREALDAADSNQAAGDAPAGSFGETDLIEFALGVAGTVTLGGRQVTIHGDLELVGPGAPLLTFDAAGQSCVFDVRPGAMAALSSFTITGGQTSDYGGGIRNSGDLELDQILLTNSSTVYGGGGLLNVGIATLTNSTIADNSAYEPEYISFVGGAGIYNSGTLAITNSTIANNYLHENWANTLCGGGGIFSYSGAVTITSSTIAHNSAIGLGGSGQGGGIYMRDPTYPEVNSLTLRNSIVALNSASQSAGADIDGDSNGGRLTEQSGFNVIGVWELGSYGIPPPGDGNLWGTPEEPLDPRLGDWTEFPSGTWGYDLLPVSPAIDAGDNTDSPVTDQRGSLRVVDGNRDGISRIDMGAVEHLPGDYDTDGDVDDDDYVTWKSYFGQSSGPGLAADGNGNGTVDAADYCVWRDNYYPAPGLPGDYDRNDVVEEADYDFWKANFGATSGPGLAADGNGNGHVDAADYTVWRDSFEAAGAGAAVAATAAPVADGTVASLPLATQCDEVVQDAEVVSPVVAGSEPKSGTPVTFMVTPANAAPVTFPAMLASETAHSAVVRPGALDQNTRLGAYLMTVWEKGTVPDGYGGDKPGDEAETVDAALAEVGQDDATSLLPAGRNRFDNLAL